LEVPERLSSSREFRLGRPFEEAIALEQKLQIIPQVREAIEQLPGSDALPVIAPEADLLVDQLDRRSGVILKFRMPT
jgi:hypothetical protein